MLQATLPNNKPLKRKKYSLKINTNMHELMTMFFFAINEVKKYCDSDISATWGHINYLNELYRTDADNLPDQH